MTETPTPDAAPEGLTLDVMATRLCIDFGLHMGDETDWTSALDGVGFILTGLPPGPARDAAVADIMARLAGAAPAGEGVWPPLPVLLKQADMPNDAAMNIVQYPCPGRTTWVVGWEFSDACEGVSKLYAMVEIVRRARLAATPSPARSDRPEAVWVDPAPHAAKSIAPGGGSFTITPGEAPPTASEISRVAAAYQQGYAAAKALFDRPEAEGRGGRLKDLIDAFESAIRDEYTCTHPEGPSTSVSIVRTTLDAALAAAPTPAPEGVDLPGVEAVSDRVHEAWMASKKAQGVTSRKGEAGEELMVPYADLSEQAKDLDRGTVKAVYDAIKGLTTPATGTDEALREAADGWRPIESAPKDGTSLLLACTDWPHSTVLGKPIPVKVGGNIGKGWEIFGASWQPTHWMPLPAPPAALRTALGASGVEG